MYFLAGSEVCLKRMPAFSVTSSSCGMERPVHLKDLAPGGGGGGVGCPSCPRTRFAAMKIRKSTLASRRYRYLFNSFLFPQDHRLCMGCIPEFSRCFAFRSL